MNRKGKAMISGPLEVPVLKVEHLHSFAVTPKRATLDSAGLDLYSPVSLVIPAGGTTRIWLGLAFYLPEGTYGRIAERSSLAFHHNIVVKGGVIDRDFHGNVGVLLYNHGNENYEVKAGDRIAQLILEKILTPVKVVEAGVPGEFEEETAKLKNTRRDMSPVGCCDYPKSIGGCGGICGGKKRDVNGFGSTGR